MCFFFPATHLLRINLIAIRFILGNIVRSTSGVITRSFKPKQLDFFWMGYNVFYMPDGIIEKMISFMIWTFKHNILKLLEVFLLLTAIVDVHCSVVEKCSFFCCPLKCQFESVFCCCVLSLQHLPIKSAKYFRTAKLASLLSDY